MLNDGTPRRWSAKDVRLIVSFWPFDWSFFWRYGFPGRVLRVGFGPFVICVSAG